MKPSDALRQPLKALLLVAILVAGSLDLHALRDSGEVSHGLVVAEVTTEACDHGESNHVETRAAEAHEHCALCVRTLHSSSLHEVLAGSSSLVPLTAETLPVQTVARELLWRSPAPARGPPTT